MQKNTADKPADPSWDPQQYLKFADYRLRPALELLGRVRLDSPQNIYELGCGTGQVTRLLAEQWPAAQVHGIDSSTRMLAEAAAAGPGNITWQAADIRTWSPGQPPDLIYSNAALHWAKDHHLLFPRLVGYLEKGGCLAVQMPLSWEGDSHRLMRETLANGGAGGKPLGTKELRQAMGQKPVLTAEAYYALLADRSRSLDIWETEYLQVLNGSNPVLDWVQGAGLRPILHALDDAERATFLHEYGRRLLAAYPPQVDGRTLYPFRRFFIVAVKA